MSWQLTLIAGQTSLLSQPPDATPASRRLGKYPSQDSAGASNQVSPQKHTPDSACSLGGKVRLNLLRSATKKQPQEPNPLKYWMGSRKHLGGNRWKRARKGPLHWE